MIKTAVRHALNAKPGRAALSRSRPRKPSRVSTRRRAAILKHCIQANSVPTTSVQRSSNNSHDLLLAVAELGALEQRIGYRFNDKLLGVSAFKTSQDGTLINYEGTNKPMESYRRLALLGDRVLDLVLCRNWYESGQSRLQYAMREQRLVTRFALAQMSRKLNLEQNILTDGSKISRDVLGEAFEALIGAIYVDSRYNLDIIRKVLQSTDFGNVQTNPEIESAMTEQLKPEKEPLSHPTTTADNTIEMRKRPMMRWPLIHSIYIDLVLHFRRDRRRFIIRMSDNVLEYAVFNTLDKYRKASEDILTLCSWFPTLRARYAPFVRLDCLAHRRPGGWTDGILMNYLFATSERNGIDLTRALLNIIQNGLHLQFARSTGTRPRLLAGQTVVEYLRYSEKVDEHDAFLTALRIEEQTRDYLRRKLGLPDWYDLPENKDKVLPPWRLLEALPSSHAKTVIPMNAQLHPYLSSRREEPWKHGVPTLQWLYYSLSPLSAGSAYRGRESLQVQDFAISGLKKSTRIPKRKQPKPVQHRDLQGRVGATKRTGAKVNNNKTKSNTDDPVRKPIPQDQVAPDRNGKEPSRSQTPGTSKTTTVQSTPEALTLMSAHGHGSTGSNPDPTTRSRPTDRGNERKMPFWQEQPLNGATIEDTTSQSFKVRRVFERAYLHKKTGAAKSTTPSAQPKLATASASTSAFASASDSASPSPPSTTILSPHTRIPDHIPTKSIFGKIVAVMGGNKVWFQEQISRSTLSFTSHEPGAKGEALEQGRKATRDTDVVGESVKQRGPDGRQVRSGEGKDT